jgi:non-ribosomal peptide synthetase component E (peptide arylation enzyme)
MVEAGFAPTVAAIDAAFKAMGVARQKTPERLVVLDHLPRTPTGKINKAQLRRQLSEGA